MCTVAGRDFFFDILCIPKCKCFCTNLCIIFHLVFLAQSKWVYFRGGGGAQVSPPK